MRRPSSAQARALALIFGLACGLALLQAPAAFAQDSSNPLSGVIPSPEGGAPSGGQAEPPRPEPIPIAEVVVAAERLDGRLGEIRKEADDAARVEPLLAELEQRQEALAERLELAPVRAVSLVRLDELAEHERFWSGEVTRIEGWQQRVTGRARRVQAQLGEIDAIEARWKRTGEVARESEAPAPVRSAIDEALKRIERARSDVRARRDRVLAAQGRIVDYGARVTSIRSEFQAAQERIRAELLGADSIPLWETLSWRSPGQPLLDRILAVARDDLESTGRYLVDHPAALFQHGLLFVVLLAVTLRASSRARRRAEDDPEFEATARLLARPWSAALVVALVATPLLHPTAPSAALSLVELLALVPALRLLLPLIGTEARAAAFALAGLYVIDGLRELTTRIVLLERWILTAEIVAGIALLLWLLRPRRLELLPRDRPGLRWLAWAARAALALLAVAFVTSVLGYSQLAHLLAEGVLASALLAAVLFAATRVVDGLLLVVMRSGTARRLRSIHHHGVMMQRRLARGVRWAAAAAWLVTSLRAFEIHDEVRRAVEDGLSASLPLGVLEISLGDVLWFAVAVVIAVYSARAVRFILDEDVLPRIPLPRGVPYAISSIVFYAVLMLGLFTALAAAGTDLTRFAIIGGALGVGIGFGLQNIVNNFVSGLILLFERPIQAGDTIEVGTLMGDVKRIGIRSSTVRTFDGAEVIVPNATLISDQVVNWTLSDRYRRIIVPVGVAYGTDAGRVTELLLAVCDEIDDVMSEPRPAALFRGFGDSSLNFELRAWTPRFEQGLMVASQLNVAIQRRLAEAGIEVPFPQRDLHLRSVAPELRGGAAAETTEPERSAGEVGGE